MYLLVTDFVAQPTPYLNPGLTEAQTSLWLNLSHESSNPSHRMLTDLSPVHLTQLQWHNACDSQENHVKLNISHSKVFLWNFEYVWRGTMGIPGI